MMNCTVLSITPNKQFDNKLWIVGILNQQIMHCKPIVFMYGEGLSLLSRLLPVVALPAELFQGGYKDTRPNPCNQKLARHPAHNICLVSAL